jgi:hypothetical protein
MKMDDLVLKYIQTREKKSQLKAAYDADKGKYDTLQDKIEALLLLRFKELGIDSIKTEFGTAYSSTLTSATMADWDAFRTFCQAQADPFQFLDRKANKSAVEQYRASNDELPPGINWSETRTVNFRRA